MPPPWWYSLSKHQILILPKCRWHNFSRLSPIFIAINRFYQHKMMRLERKYLIFTLWYFLKSLYTIKNLFNLELCYLFITYIVGSRGVTQLGCLVVVVVVYSSKILSRSTFIMIFMYRSCNSRFHKVKRLVILLM